MLCFLGYNMEIQYGIVKKKRKKKVQAFHYLDNLTDEYHRQMVKHLRNNCSQFSHHVMRAQ